jgi:hypothetical protein
MCLIYPICRGFSPSSFLKKMKVSLANSQYNIPLYIIIIIFNFVVIIILVGVMLQLQFYTRLHIHLRVSGGA